MHHGIAIDFTGRGLKDFQLKGPGSIYLGTSSIQWDHSIAQFIPVDDHVNQSIIGDASQVFSPNYSFRRLDSSTASSHRSS
jgi:hypothetical protein